MKYNVFSIIYLTCLACFSCNSPGDTTVTSIEQTALQFFSDSVLYNKSFYQADSGYVLLIPENYKEKWKNNGIFSGWDAVCSGNVRGISKPYFERKDVFGNPSFNNELGRKVLDLHDFYDSLKENGFASKILSIPNKISMLSYSDFIKSNDSSLAFISVRHHLKNRQEYYVQISVESKDLVVEPIFGDSLERYEFYFWFDNDKNLINWE